MSKFNAYKWVWMMEWCKARGLNPAHANIWKAAERAYKERK